MYNSVQLECTRPTDTVALFFIERFTGSRFILKIYVFLGPFTCLNFNAAHQGTSGKVAVVWRVGVQICFGLDLSNK